MAEEQGVDFFRTLDLRKLGIDQAYVNVTSAFPGDVFLYLRSAECHRCPYKLHSLVSRNGKQHMLTCMSCHLLSSPFFCYVVSVTPHLTTFSWRALSSHLSAFFQIDGSQDNVLVLSSRAPWDFRIRGDNSPNLVPQFAPDR